MSHKWKRYFLWKREFGSVIRTILLMMVFSLILRGSVYAAGQCLIQRGIAEEVLRFHVLANSDSEEDQRIKYLVRDEVMEWMDEVMGQNDLKGTGQFLTQCDAAAFWESHLDDLVNRADRVLEQEGALYRTSAEVENCWFPDRTYGDYTFPAGYYQSLRLKLGEAEGKNWWCLLYPRMCFRDCLHAAAGEGQINSLERVLTTEEYETLFQDPSEWKIAFRWF